jgi:hypothetical protein
MADAVSVRSLEFIAKQLGLMGVASLDMLPPNQRRALLKQAAQIGTEDTFGVGFQRDKNGRPQEQGLGSAGNQSRPSIEAYKKYCSKEPNFEANLARMEREFAESEARRAAERAKEEEF